MPEQLTPPAVRAARVAERRSSLELAGCATAGFDALERLMSDQERQTLDGLVQWSTLVVGSFCRRYERELAELPVEWSRALLVEATVAYLYAYGLMSPVPAEGEQLHPLDWMECVPEHLRPDPERRVREYRLMAAVNSIPPAR